MTRLSWANPFPGWTLAVAVACAAAHAAPGAFPALAYGRAAVLSGELWRLLTAHLTHGSAAHLGWNLAAFLPLGILAERELGRRYPALLAACIGAVALWLLLLAPDFETYFGLSGVVAGLYLHLALSEGARSFRAGERLRLALWIAAAAALPAKLAAEQLAGAPLFAAVPGAEPAVGAHAAGAAAGAAAYFYFTRRA